MSPERKPAANDPSENEPLDSEPQAEKFEQTPFSRQVMRTQRLVGTMTGSPVGRKRQKPSSCQEVDAKKQQPAAEEKLDQELAPKQKEDEVTANIAKLHIEPQSSAQGSRRRNRGKGDGNVSSAKKQKTTKLQKTTVKPKEKPNEIATVPRTREALNVKHQGYRPGEIQFHRAAGQQYITWIVDYTSDAEVGKILFCSPDFDYGGPFGFLSISLSGEFTVPGMGMARFTSVQHFMQFVKARCFEFIPERLSETRNPRISSKKLAMVILASHAAPISEVVYLGESFDYI